MHTRVENTHRVAEACCHHIVSKALKGRASTVKLSSDVFVSLVELEQQATVVVRCPCTTRNLLSPLNRNRKH